VSAVEIAHAARSCLHGEGLAYVIRERSYMLRFAANRPTQATAVDDVTVELAVVRGGHVGRAATNRIDHEGLARCARQATEAAELASTAGPGGHPGLHVSDGGHRVGGAFDPATARLDPARGAAAMEAASSVAGAAGLEAHGIWTEGAVEHAVADEHGSNDERTTDAFFKVVCIDTARRRSGYAALASRAADGVDAPALCESAARKASASGEVAELPSGEYPVVFEPGAVGLLIALLGATAFNGLAHAEGRGALVGRLGAQVAVPAVNLADSPHHRLTLPRSFDAEGTVKRPLALIQDGVARAVLHDRRSAALGGDESTGHAMEPGGHPNGPHPANLVLDGGGAADVAELCAPIERGVYVTRLWYANVIRPKETLVTAVTRDGTFLIENGAVTAPLRDLRLTDSLLGMLSRMQGLTSEQRLTSEGDFYGRRSASGVVCPAARVESVRFTSAAG
jgi:predicted Zn-dependent protease